MSKFKLRHCWHTLLASSAFLSTAALAEENYLVLECDISFFHSSEKDLLSGEGSWRKTLSSKEHPPIKDKFTLTISYSDDYPNRATIDSKTISTDLKTNVFTQSRWRDEAVSVLDDLISIYFAPKEHNSPYQSALFIDISRINGQVHTFTYEKAAQPLTKAPNKPGEYIYEYDFYFKKGHNNYCKKKERAF